MTEPIICTIFTKDKLAHVRTLTQSFLTQYPSGKVVALLVDEIDGYFNPTIEPFEIIAVDSLIIPSFPALTMRYEQRELCAAVKPYFLSYLLQERDYDCVCYFDPTCVIYSPLDEIFN